MAVRDGKTSLSVSATKKNPGADGGADAEASRVAPSTDQSGRSALATTAPAASDAGEEHAVMAAVVVLAERLGALVFGTGAQVLSCIRLVLEHERPDVGEHGVRTDGGDVHGRRGEASEGCGVDAAARVAQMEAAAAAALHDVPSTTASGGMSLYPGLGAGENREDEMDDTLCSVVLGLLTTLLELGEESRPNEEEEELRAMLGPLKVSHGHVSGWEGFRYFTHQNVLDKLSLASLFCRCWRACVRARLSTLQGVRRIVGIDIFLELRNLKPTSSWCFLPCLALPCLALHRESSALRSDQMLKPPALPAKIYATVPHLVDFGQ